MSAEAERVAEGEPREVVRRKLKEAAREWAAQAEGTTTTDGVPVPRGWCRDAD